MEDRPHVTLMGLLQSLLIVTLLLLAMSGLRLLSNEGFLGPLNASSIAVVLTSASIVVRQVFLDVSARFPYIRPTQIG